MRFLKASAVLLLTLIWVSASNHCALEQVVSLGFLSCDSHEAEKNTPAKSCEDDGCAEVEEQPYKSESSDVAAAASTEILVELAPFRLFLAPESPLVVLESPPGASPPEIRQTWQFSLRASLPVRAPSLCS